MEMEDRSSEVEGEEAVMEVEVVLVRQVMVEVEGELREWDLWDRLRDLRCRLLALLYHQVEGDRLRGLRLHQDRRVDLLVPRGLLVLRDLLDLLRQDLQDRLLVLPCRRYHQWDLRVLRDLRVPRDLRVCRPLEEYQRWRLLVCIQ